MYELTTTPQSSKSRIILCGQFVNIFTHVIINDIPLNAVIAFEIHFMNIHFTWKINIMLYSCYRKCWKMLEARCFYVV